MDYLAMLCIVRTKIYGLNRTCLAFSNDSVSLWSGPPNHINAIFSRYLFLPKSPKSPPKSSKSPPKSPKSGYVSLNYRQCLWVSITMSSAVAFASFKRQTDMFLCFSMYLSLTHTMILKYQQNTDIYSSFQGLKIYQHCYWNGKNIYRNHYRNRILVMISVNLLVISVIPVVISVKRVTLLNISEPYENETSQQNQVNKKQNKTKD